VKKNKILVIVIIALVLALAGSVWVNVSHVNERNRARELLMNHVYGSLSSISHGLNGILTNINDPTNYDSYRYTLVQLSNQLTMAHVLLSQYQNYYSDVNLDYGSTARNFDFIAATLTGVTGIEFKVLQGNEISEQEVRYLTALRDGIDYMRSAMESPNSLGADKNLTTTRLSKLLNEFFNKMQSYGNG